MLYSKGLYILGLMPTILQFVILVCLYLLYRYSRRKNVLCLYNSSSILLMPLINLVEKIIYFFFIIEINHDKLFFIMFIIFIVVVLLYKYNYWIVRLVMSLLVFWLFIGRFLPSFLTLILIIIVLVIAIFKHIKNIIAKVKTIINTIVKMQSSSDIKKALKKFTKYKELYTSIGFVIIFIIFLFPFGAMNAFEISLFALSLERCIYNDKLSGIVQWIIYVVLGFLAFYLIDFTFNSYLNMGIMILLFCIHKVLDLFFLKNSNS